MSRNSITSHAEQLNLSCHCVEVERPDLEASLARGFNDLGLAQSLTATHQNLFSSSPVFVGAGHLHAMQQVVDAFETLAANAGFQAKVAERLQAVGLLPPEGHVSALLGFDFHLTEDGPRLIEVNTNPGGVLLALHLQTAQKACCEAVEQQERPLASPSEVEATLVKMMRSSLPSEQSTGRLAIIDERPTEQFLYPEFLLYRELFQRHGFAAEILDPADLRVENGRLVSRHGAINGVYNRSTDFELTQPSSRALRTAWQEGAVGVTPDPRAWSAYADKRNLILASDDAALFELGLVAEVREVLTHYVPWTRLVRAEDEETLWERRKTLFFKPAAGHGSRGVYDGRKLTRRKFAELLAACSEVPVVAQERIPPSERTLLLDATERRLKLDVRCVTWRGRILMLVGRLYRGQATNMRTEGGGLATAFVA